MEAAPNAGEDPLSSCGKRESTQTRASSHFAAPWLPPLSRRSPATQLLLLMQKAINCVSEFLKIV